MSTLRRSHWSVCHKSSGDYRRYAYGGNHGYQPRPAADWSAKFVRRALTVPSQALSVSQAQFLLPAVLRMA